MQFVVDNPFLTRELRQLERRPRGVQNSLLLCLIGMAAPLLIWLAMSARDPYAYLANTGSPSAEALLWVMSTAHMVLCAIAAGYGGYRIFAAEHYRSTYDSLQLLPLSASRWLLLKLTFPVLCTLVAWSAGFPIYLLAAASRLTSTDALPHLLHKPLLLSMVSLTLALLVTPDFMNRQKRAMASQNSGLKRPDGGFWLWNSLVMAAGYVALTSVLFSSGLTLKEMPFFTTVTVEGVLWVANASVLLPAAWATASAAIVHHESKDKLAHRLRTLALLLMYLTFVGVMWGDMNLWFRILALLAIPVTAILTREKTDARKEAAGNATYIRWIAQRWDNPLLIHDLRAYGRHMSLRWYFIRTLLGVTALPFVIYLGMTVSGRGGSLPFIYWLAFQATVQIFPMTWAGIQMMWMKEWTGQTMPQLLLTPMTEREMIWGRLLAVPAFHWVGTSPILLLAAVATVLAHWQGFWVVGPLVLSLSPIALSMGAWMSGRASNHKVVSLKAIIGDLRTIALRLMQSIVLGGSICLLVFGITPGIMPPLAGWLIGLALFICNVLLCRVWIELRIYQLRQFRKGDIEVPDSSIMKQNLGRGPFFRRRPMQVAEAEA